MKNWALTLSRLGQSLVIVLTMLGIAAHPANAVSGTQDLTGRSPELPA